MVRRREVVVNRSVIRSILDYAKACHPKEGILLLKGSLSKDRITVNEVEIPPLAVHGFGFSNFPLHMLPLDFSVVGTAHSHPSGVLRPSITDLNKFYGRIMIIAAYPYRSEENVAVFDREGRSIEYEIVSDV
ncbi:peptidase [Candidatus Bathyarchaeota archaeon]|nr:MAG: peptidase [Candidatus Bathyarchaeota archaeon ex4484_40]RJS80222.1 MAG: peptidase [Candidatus Bathyarchaeota archaeon]